MGLLFLHQLQPVLHGTEEAVRIGQRDGILGCHVPRPGELGERAERRPVPDPARRVRPCTSCRSWTANSMSRIPPGPRLISRPRRPRRATTPSARAFIERTAASSSAL